MKEERNQANGIAIPNDFDDNGAELTPDALFWKIYKEARIRITDDIKKPPVALMIDGKEVLTLGNFGIITGKAKSKKTGLMSMIMAAAIQGHYGDHIKVMLPPERNKVLYIDTEQAEWDVYKVKTRVYNMCNKPTTQDMDRFKTWCLRRWTAKERLIFIERLVYQHDDVGMIFIDGLRDLIISINDEEEASEITSRLLRWTLDKKIAILTLLHQNKGDTNARGHVGSEAINKAELAIAVKKDDQDVDRSIVEATESRNRGFEPFAFRFTEHGSLVHDKDWNPASVERKITRKPVDCPLETQIKILNDLKKHLPEKPSWSDLVEQMTVTVSNLHLPIGKSIAREYITYFENDGQISRIGKARTRSAYYKIGGQNEG